MRDDPYLQGFAEGRRSMARSIAVKLAGTMSDEEIASLVGLAPDELAALLEPPTPRPEEEAAEKAAPAPHAVISQKVVTYDFARQMDGAREVKCSEFGAALAAAIRNA